LNTSRIYLDHNSATFLDESIFVEYTKALQVAWANPSSLHTEGQKARSLLASARGRIADCFNVDADQVIFFSSATEGLNTLIRKLLVPETGYGHLITTEVEHLAVRACCQALEREGHEVSYLPVDGRGALDPDQLSGAISERTSGIVLLSVNNETGVIGDLERYAAIALERGIPLVVDSVAQLGKVPYKKYEGISASCFSSYKIHGPPGVAFALLHTKKRFEPLIVGGGQEFGLRSGTENVAAIYGCSLAVEKIISEMEDSCVRMGELRDYLEERLFAQGNILINGEGPRVCNTSNLAFNGIDGETLLIQLDRKGIAASRGSACSSGAMEPSKILLAMGYSRKRAQSSLRFSLSKWTTREEIERAVEAILSCLC